MSQFLLRDISRAELDQCIGVIRKAFGTVAKDFGLTTDNCPTNPAFIKAEHLNADFDKGNLMFGVFANEQMAGFMQLEEGELGRYSLKNVAVIPEYRHMGYGKALLDFAKSKVSMLGGNTINIGIIEENTVLKNWYIESGFVHTGTKEFDHLPFTVGFMELTID